jgi:antitoxin component HigA of HigAB toxin-antitoxin module
MEALDRLDEDDNANEDGLYSDVVAWEKEAFEFEHHCHHHHHHYLLLHLGILWAF